MHLSRWRALSAGHVGGAGRLHGQIPKSHAIGIYPSSFLPLLVDDYRTSAMRWRAAMAK
jgi:hypothetical protein